MKRGDSPETDLTNSRTGEHGWPCRRASEPGTAGELVWIVEIDRQGGRKLHRDTDGNTYIDDGLGRLVPTEKED